MLDPRRVVQIGIRGTMYDAEDVDFAKSVGIRLIPIREYFAICDSYYQAIRKATPAEIETIDMARRGVHNSAAELLIERLEGKIETDFATARRLFTLICVLHIKG